MTPKLGDFSKLFPTSSCSAVLEEDETIAASSDESSAETSARSSGEEVFDSATQGATSLGNFSKLLHLLGSDPAATPTKITVKKTFNLEPISNVHQKITPQLADGAVEDANGSLVDPNDPSLSSAPSTDQGATSSPSTPSTTPLDPNQPALFTKDQDLKNYLGDSLSSGAESGSDTSWSSNPALGKVPSGPAHASLDQGQKLFAYQHPPHEGQWKFVYDHMRTKDAKHQSLTAKLVYERLRDANSAARGGVHIFLDMSNITIGFKRTLMQKYGVGDPCTMKPMPRFNVAFFDELLIRNRMLRGLNAGCSTLPGMQGPYYVHELRDLDYRVDVRHRQVDPAPEHPDKPPGRFVESMVDETIQMRIAEAVMDDFTLPGTLVIATGDAKPAGFADGFFTNAVRALKMGWHVEVVAFSMTLSQAWTRPEFTRTWGSQFRVIVLDKYLDELFACYSEQT